MEWLESLVLGLVQGITEFLPVSSDGHLLITQQFFGWLTGKPRSGGENIFFDVMLHLGTTTAILVHYRRQIRAAIVGFLKDPADAPPGFDRASVVRGALLAFVATLPLVPFAIFLKDRVDALFETDTAAPYGFLISALALAVVSFKMRGPEGGKGPEETSYLDALLIGCAQMLAPLPGVSRSGTTIVAALLLGLSRAWAVRFSLLIAVPAVMGAVVFELKHAIKDPSALGLTPDRVAQTIAAAILAGLVGYMAIYWLMKVVRAGRLWYFSVYLVVLAAIVLGLVRAKGSVDGGTSSQAVERSAGRIEPLAPAGAGLRGPGGYLDRPESDRPRPAEAGSRALGHAPRAVAAHPLLG